MSEVWFILLEGFDLFEASAASHAFDLANRIGCAAQRPATYAVRFFTIEVGPVRSNGEVALNAQVLPDELADRVDRMILVGDDNATEVLQNPSVAQLELMAWLARQGSRIGQLASIGEAAFVMTHSAFVEQRQAPDERPDVSSSTSGIDLALRMIAVDVGHSAAMQVAMQFLPVPERFGAPFRFRSNLRGGACTDERVLSLNRWIASHLRQRLTNDQLAQRLTMTERTFSRFYLRATGITPARAVECIRLEHACHAVETTLMSFKEIAQRSGFSSEEVMRRTFVRVVKMPPSLYRQQFYGRV